MEFSYKPDKSGKITLNFGENEIELTFQELEEMYNNSKNIKEQQQSKDDILVEIDERIAHAELPQSALSNSEYIDALLEKYLAEKEIMKNSPEGFYENYRRCLREAFNSVPYMKYLWKDLFLAYKAEIKDPALLEKKDKELFAQFSKTSRYNLNWLKAHTTQDNINYLIRNDSNFPKTFELINQKEQMLYERLDALFKGENKLIEEFRKM